MNKTRKNKLKKIATKFKGLLLRMEDYFLVWINQKERLLIFSMKLKHLSSRIKLLLNKSKY